MFKKNVVTSIIASLLPALVVVLILISSVRGLPGNPTESELNEAHWIDNGPLELSPERGKYALLYSLVENKSVVFSLPLAQFSTPDLGYHNGQFVSLFAPGLSIALIPGYLLGKYIGLAQVGTYLTISFFALCNFLLIRALCVHLGISKMTATLAASIFLFATPSFAYAVSLYQHHISLTFVLLSIYALQKWRPALALPLVWFCAATSIAVDNPNLFFFFPIILFSFSKIFILEKTPNKITFSMRWPLLFTGLTTILPLILFLWYNQVANGSPTQLSGTLPAIKALSAVGKPIAPTGERLENIAYLENPEQQDKNAATFFNTRFLVNGFYIHFLSPDRGVLFYAPFVIASLFGLTLLLKKDIRLGSLLLAIIGMNILLYSMWGDPYGGWAFGSRYLIPTYALSAIFLAFIIDTYRKNIFFITFFIVLAIYAVSVNTFGALTSNRNPPRVEVLSIEKFSGKEEKYTFERNIDTLKANFSKSFIYQTVGARYVSAWEYSLFIIVAISTFISITTILAALQKRSEP